MVRMARGMSLRRDGGLEHLDLGNGECYQPMGSWQGQGQEDHDWGGRSGGDIHQLGIGAGTRDMHRQRQGTHGQARTTAVCSHTLVHAGLASCSDTVNGTAHSWETGFHGEWHSCGRPGHSAYMCPDKVHVKGMHETLEEEQGHQE